MPIGQRSLAKKRRCNPEGLPYDLGEMTRFGSSLRLAFGLLLVFILSDALAIEDFVTPLIPTQRGFAPLNPQKDFFLKNGEVRGFPSSIEDTIIINDWLTIGPFQAGVREPGIAYLPDSEDFVPYEGLKHEDILTPGGELTWHWVKSENGKVKIKGDSVNYDFIADLYGIAGLLGVSYAYAEFENQGEKRGLVIAEGCAFRLNGKGFIGDPYSADYVRIPVILKDGKNKVLVSVSGFGEKDFTFKIIPAPKPVMIISKDATAPDIIYGESLDAWLGIPIVNTTPKTITNATLTFGDNKLIQLVEAGITRIAPLCVKKVTIALKTVRPISESIPGDTILVPIALRYKDYVDSGVIKIRLRRTNQSRKETFLSGIDGSVQYYALLPPTNYDSTQKYALILTLHGAGVEAVGLPDSYTQKDWAFIVAPTNRRPFGFDWQDWGRLDALEVLDLIKKKYPIDENRIYLTGHSMGGHGVWHIGLVHSDLFAAIAPSAGWSSFPIYIPWSLQKSLFFGHPDQLGIRDKVLREDNPLNLLCNARNLPIYILQGGDDDNVPPIHARLFAKYLKADAKLRKAEFIYKEVPGMGHWWDNDTLPGTTCVDNPELIQFLFNHTRDPYPKHIHFKTTDLGQNNKHFWITIDQLDKLYEDAVIDAYVQDQTIRIEAVNINQFTLNLNEKLIQRGKVCILINDQKITYDTRTTQSALGGITFTRERDGNWKISPGFKHPRIKHNKVYGPAKQAYFSPFVLVYGTKGDSAMTDLLLHQARIQALTWWIRANGLVEILPDTEVNQSIIKNYNLILFGNFKTNSLIQMVQSQLPIKILEDKVQLNKSKATEHISGDLGIIFVYPNPLNPEKLILIYGGTNEKGKKLSDRFGTLYSGAGLPDFLILSEEVKQKGWGGIKVGGFFTNLWQLE